jgi:signal transduction histidine kinase
MTQTYSQQLRGDSIAAVVPVTAVLTPLISLLAIAVLAPRDAALSLWSLWAAVIISPLAAIVVRRLIQRERQRLAGTIFVAVHLLLISLIMEQMWQPGDSGSALPYLFSIFVVLSAMLIDVTASFLTWFVASLLILITAGTVSGNLSWSVLQAIAPPIFINFGLALSSFLAAIDWKMAVESVSELQRRAMERRDELFQMKEEMSLTNAKLKYLNEELDTARLAAENERDMRTRFMNNVSHELRTPLNAIVNFAYILAQGGRGTVTAEQVDYLHRMEKSGHHLLNVLNDLLDMARIESGEFKLHLETADLADICEEAVASTRGLILDKPEVELVRDFPAEWPLVQVDKMRLKQALINLLGNAAKYTDQGHIALRVRANGEHLHLIVEDTGLGIAPENHQLIFQEFRQVEDKAARRRTGTGLGLPITRHLIERHGGQIIIDSDLGRGSTFTILLPLAAGEA